MSKRVKYLENDVTQNLHLKFVSFFHSSADSFFEYVGLATIANARLNIALARGIKIALMTVYLPLTSTGRFRSLKQPHFSQNMDFADR